MTPAPVYEIGVSELLAQLFWPPQDVSPFQPSPKVCLCVELSPFTFTFRSNPGESLSGNGAAGPVFRNTSVSNRVSPVFQFR